MIFTASTQLIAVGYLTGKLLRDMDLMILQRRYAVEFGVYGRQVISFKIVFDRKLPVGLKFKYDRTVVFRYA